MGLIVIDNGQKKQKVDPRTVYFTQNVTITIAGQVAPSGLPTYAIDVTPLKDVNGNFSVPIEISSDIVDGDGNIQTQISKTAIESELGVPSLVLKMPLVKMVGGKDGSVVNEAYFTVDIVDGVLTASGNISESGDWKLLENRINASLLAIGRDWKVQTSNINFLV